MEVASLEEHQALANKLEAMERKLELMHLALSLSGWVHHTEAQRLLNVAELKTLKGWRDKGELQMRQVGERTHEVSLLSIASKLLAKGYNLETVAQKLAA